MRSVVPMRDDPGTAEPWYPIPPERGGESYAERAYGLRYER